MGTADEIRKLHDLFTSGVLSEEEYLQAKERLLSNPTADPSPEADARRLEVEDAREYQKGLNLWSSILHFSMVMGHAIPFGGWVIPIVIWQIKKDDYAEIDRHGRHAVNWLLSQLIYLAVGAVLTFVIIGVPLVIAVVVLGVVFPVIAGVKALQGEIWRYPLSIQFLSEPDDQAEIDPR